MISVYFETESLKELRLKIKWRDKYLILFMMNKGKCIDCSTFFYDKNWRHEKAYEMAELRILKENLEKEEKLRKETEDNNNKLIRGKTTTIDFRPTISFVSSFQRKTI